MSFAVRPSPARISEAAAVALPRPLLFALLIVYIVAGLFGRDPWLQEDAAAFGIAWTMAHGSLTDWLLPNIAGLPIAEEGPLAFWVSAALISVFGGLLGDALAARLATVVWFALAATALWYTTYRLARREETQPLSFVFGGQAHTVDYGRLIADIGLLLFLATVGLVVRLHELNAESAAMAWVAVALFGLALGLERPRRGALVAGLAIGALALARGPATAGPLLLAVLAAIGSQGVLRERVVCALMAAVAAAGLALCWPLLAIAAGGERSWAFLADWLGWNWRAPGLPGSEDALWIGRNLLWALWPLWPLAGWAAYAWRDSLAKPALRSTLILLAGSLVALLIIKPVGDAGLMLLVPPLVVLAAFGSASLRRAADNLLDWFAIATFTLFSVALWAYFVALQTGSPPKMAASAMRLVPGYEPSVQWGTLLLALAASGAWVGLVLWRTVARPAMLWRGALMAATGLTLLWVSLTVLFMPAIDFNRSYAALARQIADQVEPRSDCMRTAFVTPGQRALLAYHGGITFEAPDRAACRWLLQRDSRRSGLDDLPPTGGWVLAWEGQWPARRDETFRLYRSE
jgi:4-amino-4-deoxy-L-arabinose transferase-like glycosyltransferase